MGIIVATDRAPFPEPPATASEACTLSPRVATRSRAIARVRLGQWWACSKQPWGGGAARGGSRAGADGRRGGAEDETSIVRGNPTGAPCVFPEDESSNAG